MRDWERVGGSMERRRRVLQPRLASKGLSMTIVSDNHLPPVLPCSGRNVNSLLTEWVGRGDAVMS